MDIREQIERLRGPLTLTCAKQDALEAADTMEKLLAVYEAALKWRKAIGSEGEAGRESALCDALDSAQTKP